jgi:hypothetical protein
MSPVRIGFVDAIGRIRFRGFYRGSVKHEAQQAEAGKPEEEELKKWIGSTNRRAAKQLTQQEKSNAKERQDGAGHPAASTRPFLVDSLPFLTI